MNLTLAYHPVQALRFGTPTRLDGTTLDIDTDDLRALLLEDEALADVAFEQVAPGEDCRAGPVFDIIEPRAKAAGDGPDFPGILGPPLTAGKGTTHVLSGMAVTVLDEHAAGGSRGSIGRVLEMTGPAAEGSCYSPLHHLVVVPRLAPGKDGPAAQRAKRVAGLKTAVYLARAAASEAYPPKAGPSSPWIPARRAVRACPGWRTWDRSSPASAGRSWTSRCSTGTTPRGCCRCCCIPTSGWTARW